MARSRKSASRDRLSNRRLLLEQLQARELMAIDMTALLQPGAIATYSTDGSGNNVAQAQWGSTDEQLLRLSAAKYGDGISSPSGSDRPSARAISNAISDQGSDDIISDRNLSAFIYAWGQFIDHDIGLTPTAGKEKMSIPVPKGDPYFDPASTGTKTIDTTRSVFDPTTGTSTSNPRQQINTLTAWIDGSMIYGADKTTSDALRSFQGGHLKLDSNGMLPLNNSTNFPNGTVAEANDSHIVPDNQLYAAGDVRANENVELTSLHTVFVREHNRWADRLAAQNPKLTDSELYLRARAIVIGEIQSITFNEWLPTLLGSNAMARYQGYNAKINPELSNEFSTATFRFGHSLLGDDVEFLDNNGNSVAEEIPLSEAFFNPTVFKNATIDNIFKYLASDPSSEMDTKVVGSLRNFLFGPPGSGGFDLASLNIERGRDHGLADYNTVRASIGMPKAKSFADITHNTDLQNKLKSLYGSVDKIDLWVGILAEDHVPGGSIGPTGTKIISDQFQRIRNGDRFWYQNEFGGQLLQEIQNTKLSDIIKRNTKLTNLQSNLFVFNSSIEGTVYADRNNDHRRNPPENGLAGWTVALIDSEGTTVATQITNRDGHYRFDVQSGVRTDTYTLKITKDPAGRGTSIGASLRIPITRGDQWIQNADLPVGQPAPPTKNLTSPNTATPSNNNSKSDSAPASLASMTDTMNSAVDLFFSDLANSKKKKT